MAIVDLRPVVNPLRERGSERDTGIDFVRALCVIGVVTLHALMVGVTVTSTAPQFVNASEGSWWIIPLSWVFQVMPLFFMIGGFAGYTSYLRGRQRGHTPAEFVAARIHRLLLPAVVTIAVVGTALTLLLANGLAPELVTIAGYRFSQPLWFLGVFLLCQTLLPALVTAHQRAPWLTIGVLVTAAASVDALRISSGIEGIGFLNLAFVWLALQQLGFFLADGRISSLARRTQMGLGLAAVAALVLSIVLGVHSPDLIANINPPTTALLLVGVAHTMLISLLRERLIVWSRLRIPRTVSEFVTPRAMTIYLWHMSVLLALAGASAVFAIVTGIALPDPSSLGWWVTRPAWLFAVMVLVTGIAMLLSRVEARRSPVATRSNGRLVVSTLLGGVAIVIILVSGATPLTAAIAVLLIIIALRLARGPKAVR